MSRRHGDAGASYLTLLRIRPAQRLVYALSAGTISFGMVSLTLLLTVERTTGSYPEGGYAVGLFALGAAVSAPPRGRLLDRRGARRLLPALAAGYSASLLALDGAALAGAPLWVLLLCATGVGASTPPFFASARAAWPRAVDAELLRRGYALTSLISDAGQVAGPAIAGGLFLVARWLAPLVCVATAGVAAYFSVPPADPARARPVVQPMPPLAGNGPLQTLLGIAMVFGIATGLVQVGVPTVAARWHEGSLGGPLLGVFACGSVLGALWFGARTWRRPVLDRYLLTVFLLGLLLAPVALAGGPATLVPLLLAAGLFFGPAIVSLFEALDVLAPGSGIEALTWATTTEAIGTAAGSSSAAVLVASAGAWAPFLGAAAVLALPAGALLAARGRRAQLEPGTEG